MLSNLLWVSSLIASCFSCVMVKILKDFCVMAVARERSRLVPLKAIPTGNPTPLANVAIEIPPVITVDNLACVYDTCDCIESFHFFGDLFTNFDFIKKNASISDNLFNRYNCGSCGAVSLGLHKFWFYSRIHLSFI